MRYKTTTGCANFHAPKSVWWLGSTQAHGGGNVQTVTILEYTVLESYGKQLESSIHTLFTGGCPLSKQWRLNMLILHVHRFTFCILCTCKQNTIILHCFDARGRTTGSASGLSKVLPEQQPKGYFGYRP